jgi:hypothetical protein
LKSDEEKSKHANLAQEIGFAPAFGFAELLKGAANLCTFAREECNKYDLTCFSLSLIGQT